MTNEKANNLDAKPKMSRKEQKALTRDRIVDAGIQVLLEGGFEAFKMRPVANKAGIAQPTIYAHFSNMEELLAAISDKVRINYVLPMQAMMLQMADQISGDDLPNLFRNIYTAIMDLYLSKPELFCFTINGGQSNPQYGEFMRKDVASYKALWSEFFFDNAPKIGLEVDKETTSMTVDCIFGMLDAFLLGHLENRYTDKQKMVNTLTDFTIMQLAND